MLERPRSRPDKAHESSPARANGGLSAFVARIACQRLITVPATMSAIDAVAHGFLRRRHSGRIRPRGPPGFDRQVLEESIEVLTHLLGRGITSCRLARDGLVDDGFEVLRDSRLKLIQSRGSSLRIRSINSARSEASKAGRSDTSSYRVRPRL